MSSVSVFCFRKHFRENFHGNSRYSRKYTFSKHCHVLAVLFRLPIRPTCPVQPVSGVLSEMSWPDPYVLFRSCSNRPAPGRLVQCPLLSWSHCHVLVVLSFLSCHFCPFQAQLSRLTCQANLSRLSCSGCPVPAILSQLSYPYCPVLAFQSRRSCPIGPVPDVLSQLPRLFNTGCPVWAILSLLSCSGRSASVPILDVHPVCLL